MTRVLRYLRAAKIGRKYTLLAFSVIFIVGAVSDNGLRYFDIPLILNTTFFTKKILQTIAGTAGRGLGYIYSGRVIAGVGVGAISAVAPAFVSECSPKEVRGRITGLFQIMVAIGVMLSYYVNCM